MTKSDFFQLLDDNQHEITTTNARVRLVNRVDHVEVILSVPGHAVFTLSRHNEGSKKSQVMLDRFTRWFAEWSELDDVITIDLQVSAENDCVVSRVEMTERNEPVFLPVLDIIPDVPQRSVKVVLQRRVVVRVKSIVLFAATLPAILTGQWRRRLFVSMLRLSPKHYTPDKKMPDSRSGECHTANQIKEYPQAS